MVVDGSHFGTDYRPPPVDLASASQKSSHERGACGTAIFNQVHTAKEKWVKTKGLQIDRIAMRVSDPEPLNTKALKMPPHYRNLVNILKIIPSNAV